jgi:hypothetical protein
LVGLSLALKWKKVLAHFIKKLICITHLIFVVKAKRDGGKTFFYILLLRKKSPKTVLAKDLCTKISKSILKKVFMRLSAYF